MADAQDSTVSFQANNNSPTPVDSVSDVSIGSNPTPYVLPRQTGTGVSRGTQTVNGLIAITDPASGVTQILMGLLPDGTFGIVVTPAGTDAYSVFTSD